MLEGRNISKSIHGKKILSACGIGLRAGRFTAVVGPNGAGKTTLLKILSGEDRKFQGDVALDGKSLTKFKSKELSRRRAILPQQTVINFPFTVRQVVEIGRYPHQGPAGLHLEIIEESIRLTGLENFANRMYHTLSGGEKQRVQMARVISQISADENESPRYLLLDEPTSSLDIAQQHLLLSLASKMCGRQVGVMAVLHDLNLAMQYADDILLLKNGKMMAYGPVSEIISEKIIGETFGHRVRLIYEKGQPVIIPQTLNNRPVEHHLKPDSAITTIEQSLLSYTNNGK